MKEQIIQADVLCVGGGIAGLMAAIRASELGAKVVVADKANTLRSGSAGLGNDHFRCYIPEVHGPDIKPNLESLVRSQVGGPMRNMSFMRTWMEKSFDIIKLWESWGIPMKYEGRYEFAGHGLPGRMLASLKYSGRDQKSVLTREALKRGVTVMNRAMLFDLITSNGSFIALGINLKDDTLLVFHAKSVVLATGLCTRLYPSPTPGWMFNIAYSPNNTGDGRAMAYNAGAELANLELTMRWAGPKYFARCGKGTWVGVLRDPEGKPIGPFVTKPDRKLGDMAADIWHSAFEDFAKSGKGPVYMDCRGISDDDYQYMAHWLRHEGNASFLDYLEEEAIDLKERPVEFSTYEMHLSGGVLYNEKGETSVKGLYAAGDELFGGISCAATFGWIAGDSAGPYAQSAPISEAHQATPRIEERKQLIKEMLERKKGPGWKEANLALQQIMQDYAGPIRSESLLTAGLAHVRRLKQKVGTTLVARDGHELVRSLELVNLVDLAELLFLAAMERKETRAGHVRVDYPFTNPLLDKLLIVRKGDEGPVMEWRELRR
ncbi:MAG: succinate dehydrogenase/fumarate reductase flavoprotein subunit [Deltaproteobacteria bacterium]|jgi:succinate dehydrogenase/fumarate reductase flavoprotein subunit|nr:succinate dehydrogenase/fumarate reductase flavoprotein subunit [Deltaproteobacteria bacterium]